MEGGKNNFLRPEQECVVAKAAAAAAYFFDDRSAKGHRAQPRGDTVTQLTKPFGLQSLLYYYKADVTQNICFETLDHFLLGTFCALKYHALKYYYLLYVCYNYYD